MYISPIHFDSRAEHPEPLQPLADYPCEVCGLTLNAEDERAPWLCQACRQIEDAADCAIDPNDVPF